MVRQAVLSDPAGPTRLLWLSAPERQAGLRCPRRPRGTKAGGLDVEGGWADGLWTVPLHPVWHQCGPPTLAAAWSSPRSSACPPPLSSVPAARGASGGTGRVLPHRTPVSLLHAPPSSCVCPPSASVLATAWHDKDLTGLFRASTTLNKWSWIGSSFVLRWRQEHRKFYT